jgi:Tetracyclin repressor-like, C-terminal domain
MCPRCEGKPSPAPQSAPGGPRRDADHHRGRRVGRRVPSRDERLAALSVIGMCNWVAWWFHPGSSHPAEPVAGQLAQNAVDMLAYPDSTGSSATAPHRALQMVRENLDYLERFLSPESGHDAGSTRPGPRA